MKDVIGPAVEGDAPNVYGRGLADLSNADLTAHATTLALDGLFTYLARKEAAIRKDPAKRTSEILTKVFGAL